MAVQPTPATDRFAILTKIDESLSKLTDYLDIIFADINSYPQELVDYLCEMAGNEVSYRLDCFKVDILNSLSDSNSAASKVVEKFQPLISAINAIANPTPENIVGVVGSIITVIQMIKDILVGPYEEAIVYITELTSKIISISNSMQRIASYTPPPAPDVNLDKFRIRFTPFSIEDLVSGGKKLPYPDPPKRTWPPNPFNKGKKIASDIHDYNQEQQNP